MLLDQSICKGCYDSWSEQDIHNKLAPVEVEGEEINSYPVKPYASGHSMAQLVVFLLGTQIFFLLAPLEPSLFPIIKDWNMTFRILIRSLYPITVVVFLMWIHRSYRNLPALGAKELKQTPGWAVGGFFVPIMNLFHPFQVVREIWKASDPNSMDGTSWKTARTSPLIGWWWALFLMVIFIDKTYSLLGGKDGTALQDQTIRLITLGVLVFTVGAAILAIRLVREINRRQEAKFKRVSTIDPLEPDDADAHIIELCNQAKALSEQGNYREAIPLAKDAVKVSEQTFGSDHFSFGASLNLLGRLYHDQGWYAEAEPFYKKALGIMEKTVPNHPNVGTFLENLAELYIKLGKDDEAVPLLNRAREIRLGL